MALRCVSCRGCRGKGTAGPNAVRMDDGKTCQECCGSGRTWKGTGVYEPIPAAPTIDLGATTDQDVPVLWACVPRGRPWRDEVPG